MFSTSNVNSNTYQLVIEIETLNYYYLINLPICYLFCNYVNFLENCYYFVL